MTLGRRLMITNAALIAALAIVGVVSLVGMLQMRSDIEALMFEHQELRWIDEASITVAEVMGALRDEFPDPDYLLPKLDDAIRRVDSLSRLQVGMTHLREEHERREGELIAQAATSLKALRVHVASPSTALRQWHRETSLAGASRVLDLLNALAAETHQEVRASRAEASATIRWTITICLILCIGLIIAAVVLGMREHKAVTVPLRQLREGVRKLADGRFDEALPADGDDEFIQLTEDFNRMSRELAALYRDLEAKVAQRSGQLVRSERLASVGFLAAGVAHEINNPLGIISTYAELSLRDLQSLAPGPAVTQLRQSLQVMKEEAFRCKGITEKLLSLSRMGDGSRTSVPVRRCIDDVAVIISRLPRFSDRRLSCRVDDLEGVTIQGNEAELKQVVLNLIVNAMEAVEPGGQVRVEASVSDNRVQIDVIDDGCGMTRETIDQVFEPFYTRKQGNAEHGSGLGLSICHAIIEAHHGRITAQSDGPGLGSRFTVVLPRHAAPLSLRELEVIHE